MRGISYSTILSHSTRSPLPGVCICFIFMFSFAEQENNTEHIIIILLEISSSYLNLFFIVLKKNKKQSPKLIIKITYPFNEKTVYSLKVMR